MKQKPSFARRTLTTAGQVAAGHFRKWGDAAEALHDIGAALLKLVIYLLFPLTFWLAPLYVWLLDKDEALRERARERAFREFTRRSR